MKTRSGFSLIEVLCGVAILGIALLGLTRGLTTGLLSSKEAQLQTAAAFAAESRIELLRADGFLVEGTDEGELSGALAKCGWKQSVTETSTRGLYDVTVRIEETDSGKIVFELKTLLFDPPLDLLPEDEGEKRQEDNQKRERRRN